MRRRRGRISFGDAYMMFLIALMIIGGSAVLSLGFPKTGFDGPVICDGQEMGPGDQCRVASNGSVDITGYEDLRAQQLAGHGWELQGLVIGGVMLLMGLFFLGLMVRQYRRR
ncbi:hypothetical protein AB0425_31625 [Actinosynnema sp. NPDC051121]|nr:hypothetical protein [Saccharothrix sp.]